MMNYIDSLRLSDEGVLYKSASNSVIKYLTEVDLDNTTKALMIKSLKSLDLYVRFLEAEANSNHRNSTIAKAYPDLIREELNKGGYIRTEQVSEIATNVLGEIVDKIEESNHPNSELLKKATLKSIAKLILEINGFKPTREARAEDKATRQGFKIQDTTRSID
jgi:hypothetical protein